MHSCRFKPGVVALMVFYMIWAGKLINLLMSVEIYNPITNTWIMEILSGISDGVYGRVGSFLNYTMKIN